MTVSQVSIELIVDGQPYIFRVDATDGTQTELVNWASGRGIGDTFSRGATIQMARGGYMENYAVSGIQLLDEQGSVAFDFPCYNLEQQNAGPHYPVGCAVGLNYQLVVTSSASLA